MDAGLDGRLAMGGLEPDRQVVDDGHHSAGEEEHEKHAATDGTVKTTRVGTMTVFGVRASTARKAMNRTAKVTRIELVDEAAKRKENGRSQHVGTAIPSDILG